jgi:hypothetical protein
MVACSGGDRGVPVAYLGETIGQHMCPRLFECCESQEIRAKLSPWSDTEDSCLSFYTFYFGGWLQPLVRESVAAGRMVYHGDRAADCLDLLSSMSCADFGAAYSQMPPWGGCADPFEGLVVNGSACANNLECANGYCEGEATDNDGNVTAEGTCRSRPTAGSSCPDGECAEGAYCDSGLSGDVCVATVDPGADCDVDAACVTGNCVGIDRINDLAGTCAESPTCDGW